MSYDGDQFLANVDLTDSDLNRICVEIAQNGYDCSPTDLTHLSNAVDSLLLSSEGMSRGTSTAHAHGEDIHLPRACKHQPSRRFFPKATSELVS